MSDDVTPMKRVVCPCGWDIPKNVSIVGVIGSTATIALEFDCPHCGRRLQMGGATRVVQDEDTQP